MIGFCNLVTLLIILLPLTSAFYGNTPIRRCLLVSKKQLVLSSTTTSSSNEPNHVNGNIDKLETQPSSRSENIENFLESYKKREAKRQAEKIVCKKIMFSLNAISALALIYQIKPPTTTMSIFYLVWMLKIVSFSALFAFSYYCLFVKNLPIFEL